jgi:hypothetical protein
MSNETPPGQLTYHPLLWSSVSAAPQDLNTLISAAAAKEYLLSEARRDFVNTISFLLKPTDPATCASTQQHRSAP